MTERKAIVVFDLDGTLALTGHRAHFLEQKPKDWRSFYAACDEDLPNMPIISILRSLDLQGFSVEIWSGRSKEVLDKTAVWLKRYHLDHIPLMMREIGDHRPDTVLKKEWLELTYHRPFLVFEDRASVVTMYREQGITCCQVAPGDF